MCKGSVWYHPLPALTTPGLHHLSHPAEAGAKARPQWPKTAGVMMGGKKGGKMDGKSGRAGGMTRKKKNMLPHGRPEGGGKKKNGKMEGKGGGGGMNMAKA